MILFIIIIAIPLIIFFNFKLAETIICKPPNVFCQVFAPPGTGKTTLAAKIVKESLESGRKVYSNVPILGAIKFEIKDLGNYKIQNCTLIIDEAGTALNNRNWQKNLTDEQVQFLNEHRHHDVDIYLFSQAYGNVDNKFRDLTTRLLMLKKSKWIPFRIRAISIYKTMDLINGQIVEYFEIDKGGSFGFFNMKLWAYFNSYYVDRNLPDLEEFRYIKSEMVSKQK